MAQTNQMAEKWNDLFVRTDVLETSPENRKGNLGSPDIIPAGKVPVDPAQYTTEASYRQYYNNSLYQNVPNYIYVRAKNASQTLPKSGKANLVLTNPAIIVWPGGDGWTRIKNGQGSYESQLKSAGSSEIGPNKIGVTDDAFVYVPDQFGHRCLVTWLDTTDHPHPEPPPKITTVSELVKFLAANPNYAHHNIDIVPDTTGKVTKQSPYSQMDEAATVRITLNTVNCKGFRIGYNCPTPLRPNDYITLGGADGLLVTDESFSAEREFDIPKNFQGDIYYFWNSNNLKPEPFSVSLIAYTVTRPGHPVYELCLPHHHFGFQKENENDDRRFYPIGSVTVMRGTVWG